MHACAHPAEDCFTFSVSVGMCIHTYHMPNNYVAIWMAAFRSSTGVATMSSLSQLQVQDTEEQKQCRCDVVRLAEIRNARRKKLLMIPIEELLEPTANGCQEST